MNIEKRYIILKRQGRSTHRVASTRASRGNACSMPAMNNLCMTNKILSDLNPRTFNRSASLNRARQKKPRHTKEDKARGNKGVSYDRLCYRSLVTELPQVHSVRPYINRTSTYATGSKSCLDLKAGGDSRETIRGRLTGGDCDGFKTDDWDDEVDKRETVPRIVSYDELRAKGSLPIKSLAAKLGTDDGGGHQSKHRICGPSKEFCLDSVAGGDGLVYARNMPIQTEQDLNNAADDDEEDDEEESGAPQAVRSLRHTVSAFPTHREIARERHRASMEDIVRKVEPHQILDHLRQYGFFNYSYSQHIRKTIAGHNTKHGKKKPSEKLLLQIGIF